MQVWRNVDYYQLLGEVLEVLENRRTSCKGRLHYYSNSWNDRFGNAHRGYPLPPSFNIRILNMVRREIGNIPDTWDGCYLGQTLDVSMTTAGSRPISFEFRVNQRSNNWELIPTLCQIRRSPPPIISRAGTETWLALIFVSSRRLSRLICSNTFLLPFPAPFSIPRQMHYLNRKVCA